jgi:hypothetical protein
MINMMYLVLTALLALNVSNEVLNAFKIVNDGLKTSNSSLIDKNNMIYSKFDNEMENNAEKTKPFRDKALEAKKISKDIYDQLEKYKQEIITEAKGINPESGDIVQRDNIDVATRTFVEDGGKKGKELHDKLLAARKSFQSILGENFSIPLNPDDILKGKSQALVSKGWEYAAFNHVPATAAITILSKFQNDVISSEGAVVDYLIKQINAKDFKFDQLAAAVIAPSSYLMQGQKYTAQIFVAASSKSQDPEVFIGGIPGGAKKVAGSDQYEPIESKDGNVSGSPLKVENGKGIFEAAATAVGEKKYGGVIRVKNPDGSGFKLYPFEGSYQVGAKSIVVSPTKMNVLYIGVDNPMKISAAGVQAQDVSAAISSGTLSKGANGEYIAKVTTVGKTTISVSAKIDGKMQSMGAEEFRIKRIPDPIPTLGGKLRGGNAQAGTIKAQSGLVALLENFDFEARFAVQSFTMLYSSKGELFRSETSGPMFNAQMQGFLNRAKPKDIIFIDDIKVVGPDGQSRRLGQIAFTII